MAASDALGPQFSHRRKLRKDPHPRPKKNHMPNYGSKTMINAGGHIPPAPDKHPHRDHAGVRSHRAK